ncbi:early nodulin-5-like [Vicia villosa]|uniref:early nodulin-5-like n=1 Tax=Vicia villosa TaxID=3911 RepID=UPI00273CF3DE|nr:early nodulin-5-like [Vicia villosa]
MASSSSSPILLMIIFSMCLLFSYSESTEYIAGDNESSWKVNFPSKDALIDWATRHQFTYSDAVVNEHEDDCNTKVRSKIGDMVVTKRPLVLPPLITLPQSPSPAPAPNSSSTAASRGFVVLLEVSLAMLMLLIWL